MHKLFTGFAVVGALLLSVAPARAAGGPSPNASARALGIVPARHGAQHNAATVNGFGQLRYHSGGSVQTGTHHTYAIFWGSNFTNNTNNSDYKGLINQYFDDVAHDSGSTGNVYYSDTQYYQTIGGVTTHVTYSESHQTGGKDNTWLDGSNPTTSGCSNTDGGNVACVTDAQLQTEVTKAIQANNWPTGQSNEYFVFLGNGISTCTDSTGSQCAFSYFCAYHSSYTLNGSTVLYSNMPYTGYNLSNCGGGNYPNNNPAADATINVTSHEANETITDYFGNAWYDYAGYENGDKCAWIFGTSTGTSGAQYNQTINAHHYELQGEYSDYSRNCVWKNK